MIDIEKIKIKVLACLEWITDNDPSIWRTNEMNICSHLRSLLAQQFSLHDVDVELRKETGQRPDICIHSRGNNLTNLVAFEVKIKPSFNEVITDLDKIRTTYFNEPYKYKYGVFIAIGDIRKKLPDYDLGRIAIFTVSGYGERKELSFKKFKIVG
jgi:hypothetical protein